MAKSYDAIIVGGGHNGLVCAAYLAKAGRRVLVLERRGVVGGAAVTEEVHPGFHYTVCSYVVSLLRPWIIRDLELAKHGLQIMPLETSFTPYPDGRSLVRWPDPQQTRREIAALSARDAEIYPSFGKALTKLSQFVKPIIDQPAPNPNSMNPKEILSLLRMGRRFQELPRDLAALELKLMTMSAADFLDEWFESEQLKAPMSCSGIIGTFLGVRSPGTAYVLLHHYMGEIDGAFRSWGFCKGGNGAVSQAIASAAVSYGAEIRTHQAVERVHIQGGRARSVVLENGDEFTAKAIISSLDPHRTFFRLVGDQHLDGSFLTQIQRYKMRGSSGKVNLALDRLPDFTSRPGTRHLRGDIAIAPNITYLERAYDEAKHGDFSTRPYLNIVIPTLFDPPWHPLANM